MRPWSASLECIPGMHPWNASLECIPGMHPWNAYSGAWTIFVGFASGVAWVILKTNVFVCSNNQEVRFQRLGLWRYCCSTVGTVAVLSRYCRGTVAVLSVLSRYCRSTVAVLSRTNLTNAIAGKLDFPNLGLPILDKLGRRARVVRAHCFCWAFCIGFVSGLINLDTKYKPEPADVRRPLV